MDKQRTNNMEEKRNLRKERIGVVSSNKGDKTITVTVMQEGVENKVFTIHTDAEFLRGALEQEKLIEGTESQYGLFVTTVDGVTADESLRQWWNFKDGNGDDLTVGVDSAPIADGDSFQIILATY